MKKLILIFLVMIMFFKDVKQARADLGLVASVSCLVLAISYFATVPLLNKNNYQKNEAEGMGTTDKDNNDAIIKDDLIDDTFDENLSRTKIEDYKSDIGKRWAK